MSHPLINEFNNFVSSAQNLINKELVKDENLQNSFCSVLRKMKATLQKDIQLSQNRIKNKISILTPWITSHDLLAIADHTYSESTYSKLLYWLLDPKTDEKTSSIRQEFQMSFLQLEKLPGKFISITSEVCLPKTNGKDNGRIDLVLEYEYLVLGYELKTGTKEHTINNDENNYMQTKAYYNGLKELYKEKKVIIIFMTPNRDSSDNEDAIDISYKDFFLRLLYKLHNQELERDLRESFKTLFTHFLLNVSPEKFMNLDFLKNCKEWEKKIDDEEYIYEHLPQFYLLKEFLLEEVKNDRAIQV